MKNIKYIKNREEVIELFKEYGVNKYVPYMSEYNLENKGIYYIEITENNKIRYASLQGIEGDALYKNIEFYDNNHARTFIEADEGELKKKINDFMNSEEFDEFWDKNLTKLDTEARYIAIREYVKTL